MKPSASPGGPVGFHQEKDQIDFRAGGKRLIDHVFVQAAAGPVDAGGIEEEDLSAGKRMNPEDAVAGRLRLRRGDRNLLAENTIEQCRFADIRSADDGYETGAETPLCLFCVVH